MTLASLQHILLVCKHTASGMECGASEHFPGQLLLWVVVMGCIFAVVGGLLAIWAAVSRWFS